MKAFFAFLLWLLWLLFSGKEYLQSNWDAALVLFAAALLVPAGLRLLRVEAGFIYEATVVLLSLAYYFTEAPAALRALLALPYIALAGWISVRELAALIALGRIQLLDSVRVAALAYWSTGAVFALCSVANFQPLQFDPVIVSLTAAHFHVAGFVLATVAYCTLLDAPGPFTRLAGWGVLGGMPLVAIGIVLTKWGYAPTFEWVAALLFVVFAALLAGWQLVHAFDSKYPLAPRRYWLGGVLCLLVGLSLAALYALRFVYLSPWLSIPTMKIWHGTLNTLGFGWLSLRGWELVHRRSILP